MIKVINGKTYNSDTATALFDESVYYNGNYSGSNLIMVTPKGAVFIYYSSTHLDIHRHANIHAKTPAELSEWLSGREITQTEIAALAVYDILDEA